MKCMLAMTKLLESTISRAQGGVRAPWNYWHVLQLWDEKPVQLHALQQPLVSGFGAYCLILLALLVCTIQIISVDNYKLVPVTVSQCSTCYPCIHTRSQRSLGTLAGGVSAQVHSAEVKGPSSFSSWQSRHWFSLQRSLGYLALHPRSKSYAAK